MISGEFAVMGASGRIVDGDNSRSPSTVSDCYSNDEDCVQQNLYHTKDDQHYFKSNLFGNYELKSLHDSARMSEDEIHPTEETKSSVFTSDARHSENRKIPVSETFLMDHVYSSECFRVPSRQRETLRGHRMTDDSASIIMDCKEYNLETASSSEVLVPRIAEWNILEGDSFQPYENTISKSISYLSRWDDSRMCHGEEDRCTQSEYNYSFDDDLEFKLRPKLVVDIGRIVPIKSVSHYSTKFDVSKERSTQTTNKNIYKEMGVGTDGSSEDIGRERLLRAGREDPYANNGDQIMNIDSTMDTLKMHVDYIMCGRDIPSSVDHCYPGHEDPDRTINDLFSNIKQIYYLLDSKVNSTSILSKQRRHQRRFSEDIKNRHFVRGDGDIVNDPEMEPAFSSNDCHVERKMNNYYTNSALSPAQASQNDDLTCRTFELNPYDDLIRSYKSSSDRRIKSVAHKMKCNILISGPIRMFDSTNSCWNMRNKISYRCAIKGSSKELVEKCLKCLQDTFPQSCLNEKHLFGKFDNKA